MDIKITDLLREDSLEIIRQRRFDLEADDDSMDDEINEMSQEDVAGVLIGWELGSESWLDTFLDAVAEASGKDIDEIKEAIFDDFKEE